MFWTLCILLDPFGYFWTFLDTFGHFLRYFCNLSGEIQQLLDRFLEVFQHSKKMQFFWTLLDTLGHFWTLLETLGHFYVIYGWYLARWIGLRGSRVRLVSTPRSDIGELGGDPVQDPSRPPLWPPPWPPWPSWGSRSNSVPPLPRPVVAAIFKKTWNKN